MHHKTISAIITSILSAGLFSLNAEELKVSVKLGSTVLSQEENKRFLDSQSVQTENSIASTDEFSLFPLEKKNSDYHSASLEYRVPVKGAFFYSSGTASSSVQKKKIVIGAGQKNEDTGGIRINEQSLQTANIDRKRNKFSAETGFETANNVSDVNYRFGIGFTAILNESLTGWDESKIRNASSGNACSGHRGDDDDDRHRSRSGKENHSTFAASENHSSETAIAGWGNWDQTKVKGLHLTGGLIRMGAFVLGSLNDPARFINESSEYQKERTSIHRSAWVGMDVKYGFGG